MTDLIGVSLFWLCLGFYAGRKDADMDARAEIERLSAELVRRDSQARN